ncbi:hypothetical protein GCM10010435_66700 [Winogradskya consettensis]|uniref:AAA family ATPase n=1 Tax=Winogradskya consettensis TaxID=113560 RepID=A0A919SM50_9ACTN|nr:AAA domain-containing protein [Actinoplanes consettensis]GIM73967.1 hypothetical protein Aco04nite_38060 [Actinoplanes consettensis]
MPPPPLEQAPAEHDEVIELLLRRQTAALNALHHPNIAGPQDSPGRSLQDELDSKRHYEWLAFFDTIWLPLAGALAYAHLRGIAHAGLTPAGVGLTADGRVELTGLVGTRSDAGFSQDVYAFGELAIAALDGSTVPPEVQDVLDTCVSPDPAVRYPDAAVLEHELAGACRTARQRESRSRNTVWLGITRAAAGLVLGVEPLQETDFRRAEQIILDELAGVLHTDYSFDARTGQVNDQRILFAGRTMLLRAASDAEFPDRVRIISAERKDDVWLRRWRRKATDLTRMVTFQFEDPGAEAAGYGLDFLLARLEEHRSQTPAEKPATDLFELWERLLDAREALERSDRAALRRQEDALVRVRTGRTTNPRLAGILQDPGAIPGGDVADVHQWSRDDLDDSQREAVRQALGSQDLVLVQGAPGSGKTTVVAEIVRQAHLRDPGARVLVLTHTREALDQLAAAGVHSAETDPESRRVLGIQDEWLAAAFLHPSALVATTMREFLSRPGIGDLEFDLCVIDEVSRATATETLVALVQARRSVLIGDPNQLPPADEVLLRQKPVLKEYALTPALVQTDAAARTGAHVLTGQHRMVPAIGDLIETCFYSRKGTGSPGPDRPVLWVDTTGLGDRRREVRDDGGLVNPAEAAEVVKQLGTVAPGEKVLIIAPYAGQVDELRRLAGDAEVISLDAAEGRECDVVIFSVTRSNDKGDFGLVGEPNWRRISVALSRARSRLIIVGDAAFCRSRPGALRDVSLYIGAHPEECETRDAAV